MAPIGAARANLSRVPNFIPDGAVNDFESYPVGKEANFSEYTQTESGVGPRISDAQSQSGSQSLTFDRSFSAGDFFDWTLSDSFKPVSGQIYLRDESNGGAGFSPVGPNGAIFACVMDSPQIRFQTGDQTNILDSGSLSEWYKFDITDIDFTAETVSATVFDSSDTQVASVSNESFINSAPSVDTFRFGGHQPAGEGGDGADTDTFWFDNLSFSI